ncbi:MAG: hypothetical protein M5R38_12070 [Candidatus Methylomirabilis sp.]|nr:hypothetical protein [Candidatus Methylomirabilis sp.]
MGVLLSGNLKLADTLPIYYGVGVFNGCGRVDQCPGSVDNDGDKEYTGRLTVSPAMPFGALTVGVNADFRTFNIRRGPARPIPTASRHLSGAARSSTALTR